MFDDFVTLTINKLLTFTNHVVAHGLGEYPKQFFAYLECITADQSYSVGDRLLAFNSSGNQDIYGIKFWLNTTSIGAIIENGIAVYKKDLSGAVVLNLACWKLVIYAK